LEALENLFVNSTDGKAKPLIMQTIIKSDLDKKFIECNGDKIRLFFNGMFIGIN